MPITQVMVFATDVARLRRFYERAFGLTIVEDSPGWVRFVDGGVAFALHAIPPDIAAGIAIASPPIARDETPIKLTFAVADVGAARAMLAALGAEVRAPRTFGAETFCDAVDPEGNVFAICGPAAPPAE